MKRRETLLQTKIIMIWKLLCLLLLLVQKSQSGKIFDRIALFLLIQTFKLNCNTAMKLKYYRAFLLIASFLNTNTHMTLHL